MSSIRSFLAIDLDIDTVRAVAEAQRDLRKRCAEADIKVGWVPPSNMHVTLSFLGQIDEQMAVALEEMLAPVASSLPAFRIDVGGVGVFPDFSRPRVVWAGVRNGAAELERVHAAVSERLVQAGFALDDKPFRSHVTIGRIKGGLTDALQSCLTEHSEKTFGDVAVRHLTCYRSDLKPNGAEYHALWRLQFGVGNRHG